MVSLMVMGTSQMRNSTVLKKGCTRRSTIFFSHCQVQLVLSTGSHNCHKPLCFQNSQVFQCGGICQTLLCRTICILFSFSQKEVCAKRVNMRKKIPGRVGNVSPSCGLPFQRVHVSQNKIAPCRFLEFVDNLVITNVIGYQLAFPVAEWMCTRCPYHKPSSPAICEIVPPQC